MEVCIFSCSVDAKFNFLSLDIRLLALISNKFGEIRIYLKMSDYQVCLGQRITVDFAEIMPEMWTIIERHE